MPSPAYFNYQKSLGLTPFTGDTGGQVQWQNFDPTKASAAGLTPQEVGLMGETAAAGHGLSNTSGVYSSDWFKGLDQNTQQALLSDYAARHPEKTTSLGGLAMGVGKALAPAALVTMGIPALMGQPGLQAGLAANYAGAAPAAAAAAPAATGVPSELGMVNLPGPAGMSAASAPADLGMVNLPGPAGGWADAAALGAGGSAALGVPGPLGTPTTPGMAAPAPASSAPGSAAPASTTGGTSATGNSVVDGILNDLKKNALSIGLMGAATLGAASRSNAPMVSAPVMTQLGQHSADVANQYLTAAQSGNLTAPQQASIDQYIQQARNQVRQYFASIGQGDSSAAMQAEQQVEQQGLAMKQQMLQQDLQAGLQAVGVAQGPLDTLANYQLGQDQQLQAALGRFATGIGLMAGGQAGKAA